MNGVAAIDTRDAPAAVFIQSASTGNLLPPDGQGQTTRAGEVSRPRRWRTGLDEGRL